MATDPHSSSAASFDIIDAFSVVGPWRDREPGQAYDFEDLEAEQARFGIRQRLVLHAESRDGVPDNGNAALTRMTLMRDDTAMIWTALPTRRFGAPHVDTLMADAKTAGVAMFALFPETHGHHLAPWANRELYNALEYARLPLVLDVGNAQGAAARARYEEIHAIATAHPHLPIIVWNAFYMDERLQIPLLDLCPNVRIGLATVFVPTFGIEQYTARYRTNRLIFGSNWPRQSPGPLLTYVLYADVHRRVKSAILGDTVQELANAVRWPVHGLARPTFAQPAADAIPEVATGPTDPDASRDDGPTDDDYDGPARERPTPWLDDLETGDSDGAGGPGRGRGTGPGA